MPTNSTSGAPNNVGDGSAIYDRQGPASLLIVPGHAIYRQGKWIGGIGYPGEELLLEQHVRDGLGSVGEDYDVIVFSGGHTRPMLPEVYLGKVSNSEAEGLLEFARQAGLLMDHKPILLENFARDSFENVFFAVLCFYSKFRCWPARIGLISFPFKASRFMLVACALKIADRFSFYGSGDLPGEVMGSAAVSEAECLAEIVRHEPVGRNQTLAVDPLHRGAAFRLKRRMRTHKGLSNLEYLMKVKQTYDLEFNWEENCRGLVSNLIDSVDDLVPGTDEWLQLSWPWCEPVSDPGKHPPLRVSSKGNLILDVMRSGFCSMEKREQLAPAP